MWFGMPLWGPRAVLIGQMVGEITSLIGIVILLQSQHRLLD
jgi:ascorbate-specific PTS system EIIC-type component UlaA